MTAQPSRVCAPEPREPALPELPSLRVTDQAIAIHLAVRRAAAWRGRLRFQTGGAPNRETAEIFRGPSEDDLWQSVRGLGEHQVRALYHSLA